MKRPRQGSTIKQVAYATRMMNGQAKTKKEAALLSGFSKSVAENAKHKIESTEGYQNAIIGLATQSGNLLQAILAEFTARGIKNFSDSDLIKATNAITGAWDKIDQRRATNTLKTPEGNPLRKLFIERTETRTSVIETTPVESTATAPEQQIREAEVVEKDKKDLDLDF